MGSLGDMKSDAKLYIPILIKENVSIYEAMRDGDTKEVTKLLRARKEHFKNSDGYAFALDWLHLIGTRYYIQGIDITNAMRQILYLEKYHEKEQFTYDFFNYILEKEEENFDKYIECALNTSSCREYDEKGYRDYLDLVQEVNEYTGEVYSPKLYEQNIKGFRSLVDQLVKSKKKCVTIANFTKKFIPREKWTFLNKETFTYEEATSIARHIVDNCEDICDKSRGFTWEEHANRIIAWDTKQVKEIREKFLSNFMEQCGISSERYKTYKKGTVYTPTKKFVIVLGLFCEPFCNLFKLEDSNCTIMENLETFMNQHAMSLKSLCATITEFDNMTDNDLVYLLEDGLSPDMLAFMLKNYAKKG